MAPARAPDLTDAAAPVVAAADARAGDTTVPPPPPADARPPDVAGAPPPPPAAGCAGAKLCDDFESYAEGKAPGGAWKISKGAGVTLAVDSTRPWSGTRSVHITTPGGSALGLMAQSMPLLPIDGNTLYGRLMMFFVQPPTNTHYHIVKVSGPLPTGGTPQMTIGGLQNANVIFNWGPGDNVRISKTVWPANRWACLQWQFDAAKGQARVWVDGQLLSDATVTTWKAPTMQTLSMGIENCCASPVKVQLWMDDVAVDTKPIGCPAK